MRLVTFEFGNRPPALGGLAGQQIVDLAAAAERAGHPAADFASMECFLQAGEAAMDTAESLLATSSPVGVPLSQARLRAPISRPGKIIAVGLNYRDHSLEQGIQPPTTPVIFAKFSTSITGPYDPILIPGDDPQVDYEAEMAVVIGRRGKAIPADRAMDYVAGYMVLNDVSARRWQFADKQWVRGKSCDTFCPIGPWLTTREDVPDPHALHVSCRVNGMLLQDSNTQLLIFRVPQLIAFVSASITLEPGDIIATGTPEGVGIFRKPPVLLQRGDLVEVEIEGLGSLRNPVAASPQS